MKISANCEVEKVQVKGLESSQLGHKSINWPLIGLYIEN